MKRYIKREDLPMVLSAEDVQCYLGISRAGAYTLMRRQDFPLLSIGKRMLVPREAFLAWVDAHTGVEGV